MHQERYKTGAKILKKRLKHAPNMHQKNPKIIQTQRQRYTKKCIKNAPKMHQKCIKTASKVTRNSTNKAPTMH